MTDISGSPATFAAGADSIVAPRTATVSPACPEIWHSSR
jgi:hypothetical protein